MRFLRSLILPAVLIVLLLAGLFVAMDYYAARLPPPSDAPAGGPAAPAEGGIPPTPKSVARPVDPDAFGQPFTADPQDLARVAPREPLTPPTPPRPKGPPTTTLHRPLVLGAGLLSFGGRQLALDGLAPTPADRFCPAEGGSRWPCGMIARTAFRSYLRSRSLTCDLQDREWEGRAETRCRLMDDDIGLWLVENGWAEALPGSRYAEAGKTATEEGRGIFGADPR